MHEEGRRTDSQQLVRQWAILRLLADSGREFSVKELADQLATSKSTVQRDLATLERDFALVEEQVGKQKRVYRIDQSIRALQSIQFGTMELLALHAAAGVLDSLAGTPFHDDLRAVVTKVRGFLSPRHNGGLDALSRVFLPHARGQVDYAPLADTLDSLADAIARRRWCRVTYYSPTRGTTREHRLRPLRLVWHRAALYLLSALDGFSDVTTMAVHRIRQLEVEDSEFAAPRVDVEGHIQRAFGIFVSDAEEFVEILFDETTAWRVEERCFHPDEDKKRLPDGSLRYRIRSSAQWEIIPWVLSFCGHAELVAPESWRDAIAQAGETLIGRHSGYAVELEPITADDLVPLEDG